MAGQLLPWIDSGDAEGNRNSMQNFLGNGILTSFDFNFAGGYIDVSHVKAYIYHTISGITEAIDPVVLTGPNTIQVIPAVPNGDYLVVYRDTPKDAPLVDYTTGAVLSEENLDKANQQAIFATAEMADRFDAINASSADAIERSFVALTTAQAADAKSDTAIADSTNAVNTANAANTTAQEAKDIAEDAVAASTGFQVNLEFYTNNDTTSRGADWQTGSVASPGLQRWFAGTDTASDFTIDRYDDTGALQGSAVKVDRQTGNVTLESQLDMTSGKIVGLANGTAAGDAVNKGQMDTADTALQTEFNAQKIDKDGTLDFAAHQKLFNSTPTDPLHAASKGYVDQFPPRKVQRVRVVAVSATAAQVVGHSGAILKDASGIPVVRPAAGASGNITTNTQGANGRDQAGAFGANVWLYLHQIWGSGPGDAYIWSLSPTTPSPLPAGYTHWCPITPWRRGGASDLISGAVRSQTFTYTYGSAVLFSGSISGTPASVAWGSFFPPESELASFAGNAGILTDGSGNYDTVTRLSDGTTLGTLIEWSDRKIGLSSGASGFTPIGGTLGYTTGSITITATTGIGSATNATLFATNFTFDMP